MKKSFQYNKRKYRSYKELPDFKAYLNADKGYDIFKKITDNTERERYIFRKRNGKDEYRFIGTIGRTGWLHSIVGHIGEDNVFFGRNLKNAMRYIFLVTQEPVKTNK